MWLRLQCFFIWLNMANRIKRECKKIGCYNLTTNADGYCDQHRKDKWTVSDEKRKSSVERGYNTEWRKYRKEFLLQHPLCEDCLSKKILRTATVVDHIVAHKGNEFLFWNTENHQALCKQCHDMKTMQEVCAAAGRLIPGYVRGLPKRKYLKPSIPVYVVAGAPGSGKSAYIANHKGNNDIVIDLDNIIGKLANANPYQIDRTPYLIAAFWLRDRMINALRDNKEKYSAAWITGMFGYADDRRKLHDELNAKVYVMNTDWMSCQKNILSDVRRKGNESKYIKLAEGFWQKFSAQPFDNFVSR